MDDPKMDQLMAIEDPYSYRDRFTMPKYVVNASGDQFFCPDSSQFYYDDLPGEKHLRYVPNADHSLRESDALEGIIAFYQMVLAGRPRPTYGWTLESDGSIKVTVKDRPAKVLLWQATNSKARDFRVETIGRTFSSGELSDQGGGVYIGRIEPPSDGWTAFFVELHYESGGPFPLKVSTAVRILPDRLPHADLDPKLVPLEVRKE
jgi:PhoPQ-activated pathogenicity-related protein